MKRLASALILLFLTGCTADADLDVGYDAQEHAIKGKACVEGTLDLPDLEALTPAG